ncbi:MAG TPA: TIGR03086 family metal-binding protein [Microlunatus sp.]
MLTLYRQTADEVTKIISEITEADLARPTPCQGWDLRTLIAHQIGQLNGFAEAIATGDAPPSSYQLETIDTDRFEAAWLQATSALLDALESTAEDKIIQLAGFGELPVATALRMQLLDTGVHGWDIASSIGRDYRPDDAVVADILHFARLIAARPDASTAFAAPMGGADSDDWATALRLLGRQVAAGGEWLQP